MSGNASKNIAATALAAGAVLMLGTGPAIAAADVDTTIIHQSSCHYDSNGNQICTEAQGVLHRVQTPSGNLHFQMNLRNGFTVTAPDGQVRSSSYAINQSYLFKEGEQQVYTYNDHRTEDYGPFTCTLDSIYHYANGELRVNRGTYECTPD